MRTWITSTLLIAVLSAALAAQSQAPATEPENARIVTTDVARFWQIYDSASDGELASVLRSDYLDAGTQALRDFIPGRILGPDSLAARITRERARYESARAASLRVVEQEGEIRAAWYALEYLYPYAVFPDTYFVIGRFNSGGTISPRGAIIGAEMLPDPDMIPHLVAHELVHFQQPSVPRDRRNLLAYVVREGAADFIAELVTGRTPRSAYMQYGYDHEPELWSELSAVLERSEFGGWMYGGEPEGRPADLGYFFGYRIAEAYYQSAKDKRKAVGDIINVTDYSEFLRVSGYSPAPLSR